MMIDVGNFGERVKYLRTVLNLTELGFAKACGISRSVLVAIESGADAEASDLHQIAGFAKSRLVGLDWLLIGAGPSGYEGEGRIRRIPEPEFVPTK